ncbi:MAG TPA: MBL fold metallo-hydrolase, partial [Chloroflexaceae bacterium]|nr:MBL fold metallo-hydrolase [Chloroflexaceae bacterium]
MTRPTKLTHHLWRLPSRAMRYNAGLLASGGQVWLIDPGPHPDETAAAADLAAGLGALAGIVLTHSHWDHILGPERLPGAPTLAHELFAPTMARHREGTLAMVARWEERHGYRRAEPFRPP